MLVFISHNKADRESAREIALFLAAENIGVWFDEWEIAAGDSIVEQVDSGLQGCSHFVILWSQNAAKSNWVRKELSAALAKAIREGSPKVLPVLLDDSKPPELLADIKFLIWAGGKEDDRRDLVYAIAGHRPSMDFVRAIVRKYHEVTYDPEAKDPFGINACPQCGSDRLRGSGHTDHNRMERYWILACQECGWSTWTE